MSMGIDAVREAVDGLLYGAADELDDNTLHQTLLGVEREQRRLDAAKARLTSVWDARTVWADNGSRSAAARLATELNESIGTTRSSVTRARRLRAMPETAAALARGDIGTDHVELLARAAGDGRGTVFADHEADLVGYCRDLRYLDARRAIDYWCQRADAAAATDQAEQLRERAHLSVSSTIDGTVVINGVLDPVSGEIVADELRRLERELYLEDQRNDVTRTAAQRRAAALVEMATRSRTAPANGRRPKPLFTVLVGNESAAELCELASGTVLPPSEAARWATEADLESVLFDGPSTVISVSHRRTFTGALRRAVQVRDRRCQHRSGCDERAEQCDVDHVVPHAAQGPTSQFNGKLECSPHNRDSDLHVYGDPPLPTRRVDRLDELRCRLRWQYQREVEANPDDFVEHRAGQSPGP